MPNIIEDNLKAAKTTVTAPAGSTAGYTSASLQAVKDYLAPAAEVENLLTEAKAQQEKAAADSRDTTLQGIVKSYTSGVESVNKTAGEAQRQNYITHQMQQKNIGQQLAAAGVNGGASETTMLGLANAYGENRRLTEADRMDRTAALEAERAQQETAAQNDYNALMASIADSYTQQLAAARQAEADRQAQLLMQKFAADQQAAQAEADRAFQREMAAMSSAKSTGGVSSTGVDPNNWYASLGVPYEQMSSFSNALAGVENGSVDKNVLRREAAGVIAQFGAKAYEYLYKKAMDNGYVMQASNPTADLINNALAASAQEQLVQNALYQSAKGGRMTESQKATRK